MEKTLTYETAYAELAVIAKEIENESVSVDVLAQKESVLPISSLFAKPNCAVRKLR